MAPGRDAPGRHGTGAGVRAGGQRAEAERAASAGGLEPVVLSPVSVFVVLVVSEGTSERHVAQGRGQPSSLASAGFHGQQTTARSQQAGRVVQQGGQSAPHGAAAAAPFFQFIEHVAQGNQTGTPAQQAGGGVQRRAQRAQGPGRGGVEIGPQGVEDTASQVQRMGRAVRGHHGHGQTAQVGPGQPQSQRKGAGAAAQVEDQKFVVRACRRRSVFFRSGRARGGSGQRQAGQKRGQAHQIPGQKIAQIGRSQAGRGPVGTFQAVAFGGQQSRQITAGVGQLASPGGIQGHDQVHGSGQRVQPASDKGRGRRKQGLGKTHTILCVSPKRM